MISFDCQCGKPFRFSLKFRGREFRCNMCGRPLIVPEESIASDPAAKTKSLASVGSGETIAPVKPVLQIDLGALPKGMRNPSAPAETRLESVARKPETVSAAKLKETFPQQVRSNQPNELDDDDVDDDDIVISGSLSKVDEDHFHVDLDIEPVDEEAIVVENTAEKPKKKGFFGRGEKKEKPEKAAKPQPSVVASSTTEVSDETPTRKKGFFGGAKKEKSVKPEKTKPQPVAAPAPKMKEESSIVVSTPESLAELSTDTIVPAPSGKAAKKEKPQKVPKPTPAPKSEGKKRKISLTTVLMIIYPLALVVLGVMWYMEKGKTATEVQNAATLKSQLDTVRRELNDLKETPQPSSVEATSTDLPSVLNDSDFSDDEPETPSPPAQESLPVDYLN